MIIIYFLHNTKKTTYLVLHYEYKWLKITRTSTTKNKYNLKMIGAKGSIIYFFNIILLLRTCIYKSKFELFILLYLSNDEFNFRESINNFFF